MTQDDQEHLTEREAEEAVDGEKKRWQALYKLRSVLVEPVLGQIKEGQGFRRLMSRGCTAAWGEAFLIGETYNILKLWRSRWASWGWAAA